MISLGLFLYLFAQAVNLSVQFSRSFTRVEPLSGGLKELNNSLEQKVLERTSDLESSNLTLFKANQEMTQMEASRRSLLSNFSHELRTPLTSIQGYAQALLEGVIKDNHSKYLRLIFQKTQLIDHIFRDLLELSKLEAHKLDFRFVTVSAGQLFLELREKYELDAQTDEVAVHWENFDVLDTETQAFVKVDPARIEQVFANLLGNAKKFTPAGGVIRIHARLADDANGSRHLEIGVSDNGPGIEEEELAFVFDRFFRGKHSHKHHSAGYGLGLAICKEIMEYHKGRIEVDSRVSEGSTFRFSLPALTVAGTTDVQP